MPLGLRPDSVRPRRLASGPALVSPLLSRKTHLTQHFSTKDSRSWKIALRFKRRYLPFSVTLLKFSHDIYPGTDIPKNFSSQVRLKPESGGPSRDALIYMNNPLRTAGLTFFQKSFANEDRTTVLQVVRNPGWQLPYLACALIAFGLILQFCLHLAGTLPGSAAPGLPSPSPVPAVKPSKRFLPFLSPRPSGSSGAASTPPRRRAIRAPSTSWVSAGCRCSPTDGSNRWTRSRAPPCCRCRGRADRAGRRQSAAAADPGRRWLLDVFFGRRWRTPTGPSRSTIRNCSP